MKSNLKNKTTTEQLQLHIFSDVKNQKTTSHRIENSSSLKLMSQISLSLVPKILKRKKFENKNNWQKAILASLNISPPPILPPLAPCPPEKNLLAAAKKK